MEKDLNQLSVGRRERMSRLHFSARRERMEALQRLLISVQALELLRDQGMLSYMENKALGYIQVETAETLTTIEKTQAEIESANKRLAVMEETCEIIRSLDSDQVEDYCGPIGKHVFYAQMDHYYNESYAFLSGYGIQLRDLKINEREEYYVAKKKLYEELKALLEVVHNKLEQLVDLKMKERHQLHEHSKEIDENLPAEEKALVADLNLLSIMMDILYVMLEKAQDGLDAQIQVVKSKLGQLRDHDTQEVIAINNYQLQQHAKEIIKDAEWVFRIGEIVESHEKDPEDVQDSEIEEVDPENVQAPESDKEDINAITWENLSAEDEVVWTKLKKLNREVQIADEKRQVCYELQGHLCILIIKEMQQYKKAVEFVVTRFKQFVKHIKVPANSDEEGPEVVRHIKKWESEVVNADTVIGLKKIGGHDQEFWNMKEDREASLKEAICYLVMMLRVRSDTELISHAT